MTLTGLKKICDRHQIPTPERGYWAKLAYGKPVSQEPLPEAGDAQLHKIRIVDGGEAGLPEPVRAAKALAKARLAERPRPPSNAPFAPATPGTIEPQASAPAEPTILAATRKAMIKTRPDSAGFASGGGRGVVGFRIGPGSIERALQVLTSLLALAQPQGHATKALDEGLALVVDGETLPFTLEEQSSRAPHEPTRAELERKAENQKWGYGSLTPWPKYDHTPSGRLCLVIQANSYSGLRRTFGDRQSRKLEDLLGDVLEGFAAHAAWAKEKRRVEAARARAWRREEAHRQREQAFAKREERRAAFVEAIAVQLAKRKRLSGVLAYLDALPASDAGRVADMSAWVRGRILRTDALISAQYLDLSTRSAQIDFDERRAAASTDTAYFYHDDKQLLRFWSIDPEAELARTQSSLEWAISAGYAPGIDVDPD